MKNLSIFVLFILSIIKLTELSSQWQQRPSGTTDEIHGLSFLDLNNGMICGDAGRVWKTVDGGFTWQQVNLNLAYWLGGIEYMDGNNATAVGYRKKLSELQMPEQRG